MADVLMDRVLSEAARCSAPTWSTPGSPCRKRRSDDSDRVTSRSRNGVVSTSDSVATMPPSIGWIATTEPTGGPVTGDRDRRRRHQGREVRPERRHRHGRRRRAWSRSGSSSGGSFDMDDVPLWVPAVALLGGIVLYTSTVRPRVRVHGPRAGAAQHAQHDLHPAGRDRGGRGPAGAGGACRRQALRLRRCRPDPAPGDEGLGGADGPRADGRAARRDGHGRRCGSPG